MCTEAEAIDKKLNKMFHQQERLLVENLKTVNISYVFLRCICSSISNIKVLIQY